MHSAVTVLAIALLTGACADPTLDWTIETISSADDLPAADLTEPDAFVAETTNTMIGKCDKCWYNMTYLSSSREQDVRFQFSKLDCDAAVGTMQFDSTIPARLLVYHQLGGNQPMVFDNHNFGFIEDIVELEPFIIEPLCTSGACGTATLKFEMGQCEGLVTKRFHICCRP